MFIFGVSVGLVVGVVGVSVGVVSPFGTMSRGRYEDDSDLYTAKETDSRRERASRSEQ